MLTHRGVHGVDDGKFRFSVLETKGDHLKGNDDTEYKRKLFELFTRYADVTVSIGQLALEGLGEPMRFRMVMEKNWKQTLVDEGV
jgi:type III restriction enzyme